MKNFEQQPNPKLNAPEVVHMSDYREAGYDPSTDQGVDHEADILPFESRVIDIENLILAARRRHPSNRSRLDSPDNSL